MHIIDETLVLPDGRELAYIQAGDLHGRPLILFHGLHSSRFEAISIHEKMQEKGIRLIAIDRPGMGGSTFQKKRKVLDIVDDILNLTKHLHIERFSVLGFSSGAKYALACAYKVPFNVHSCNVVSGAPPMECLTKEMPGYNRFFIRIIQTCPWLIQPIYWFLYGRFSKKVSDEERFLAHIVQVLDDVDKKIFDNTKIKKFLLYAFREAYRQGSKGVAYDAHFDILVDAWGFNVKDIANVDVQFWHGGLDKGVPFSMTKQMIDKIPNAALKFYPAEGHLSLIFNQLDEVMDLLEHKVV
jgi:pimeloyl-ACP methyl ester carboxylesterase